MGEIGWFIAECFPIETHEMEGNEMYTAADSGGREMMYEFIAANAQFFEIQTQTIDMP